MQRSMHKVVFTFVTVAVGMADSFSSDLLARNPDLKRWIIILATQVEVAFGLFLASLTAYQSVCAGHIAGLEDHINDIARERIAIFESIVIPKYTHGLGGAFFWARLLIVIFVVGTLVALVVRGYAAIASFEVGMLLTLRS